MAGGGGQGGFFPPRYMASPPLDLFVHEVRTFDRHLPACGKVDQSEAIFICTVMHAVLAYRWLMYSFSANFDPWPPLLSHLLVHVC
jgi:hypothetical protein